MLIVQAKLIIFWMFWVLLVKLVLRILLLKELIVFVIRIVIVILRFPPKLKGVVYALMVKSLTSWPRSVRIVWATIVNVGVILRFNFLRILMELVLLSLRVRVVQKISKTEGIIIVRICLMVRFIIVMSYFDVIQIMYYIRVNVLALLY